MLVIRPHIDNVDFFETTNFSRSQNLLATLYHSCFFCGFFFGKKGEGEKVDRGKSIEECKCVQM